MGRRRVRSKRSRSRRKKGSKETSALKSYVRRRHGDDGFTESGYIKARVIRGIALGRTSGEPSEELQETAMEELEERDLPMVTQHYLRAEDFGDNPDIRASYGEPEKFSKQEPWERKYRLEKEKLAEKLLAPSRED